MAARCLAIAMLVVASIVVLGNMAGVSAQCEDKIPDIMTHCEQFVTKEGPKIPPSDDCCAVLKDTDIPCLCKHITPPVEAVISMDKAIYVARTCGCSVPPPGSKCGSKLSIYDNVISFYTCMPCIYNILPISLHVLIFHEYLL